MRDGGMKDWGSAVGALGPYQGTGGYLPNDQVKRLREAPNVKIVEAESMRIMMFQISSMSSPGGQTWKALLM